MSCKYKDECPSASGWCDGPKQSFERCIPYLIASTDHWKLEAKKQVAAAGEIRIILAERLEEIRTDIAELNQLIIDNDNELYCMITAWNIKQKKKEAEWLERMLYRKRADTENTVPEWKSK